jgi:hypothetical protein
MGKVRMMSSLNGRKEKEAEEAAAAAAAAAADDAVEPIDEVEFTTKRKDLEASVKVQADLITKLKADGQDPKKSPELQQAITTLRQQKQELKELVSESRLSDVLLGAKKLSSSFTFFFFLLLSCRHTLTTLF